MYQQLNYKEILDSLTYYKQVLQLGNLHGSIIKLACTQLIHNLYTKLYTYISTWCRLMNTYRKSDEDKANNNIIIFPIAFQLFLVVFSFLFLDQ